MVQVHALVESMGGTFTPSYTNTIEYKQIMTTGNAVDFGDLSTAGGSRWNFKWSWRFRIMSDIKN